MVRVASALARREGAGALVTGDSLGQVSSQTLQNLDVVERAAQVPLLRPLVAWDKAEIVREAEAIGTFDLAGLPAEDCCQLFSSPLAETRAQPERLDRLESRLDLDETVEQLVASAQLALPRLERTPAGSLVA